MEGFGRGKRLHKMGMAAQDTSELYFDNVKVPKQNVLGAAWGWASVDSTNERTRHDILRPYDRALSPDRCRYRRADFDARLTTWLKRVRRVVKEP